MSQSRQYSIATVSNHERIQSLRCSLLAGGLVYGGSSVRCAPGPLLKSACCTCDTVIRARHMTASVPSGSDSMGVACPGVISPCPIITRSATGMRGCAKEDPERTGGIMLSHCSSEITLVSALVCVGHLLGAGFQHATN
jgi:hypothetical protein